MKPAITTARLRGFGHIYKPKRSQFWWIKYYRDGVPFRESTHTTDDNRAQKLLLKKVAEAQTDQFCPPTIQRIRVAELADNMLREYKVNGRKSLKLTEQRWKQHLEPFFGRKRAAFVTTDMINRYIENRQAENAENGTINRELAALKRMFNLAYRSTPRKVSQVPSFPTRLAENAPRQGFVEDAEYNVLRHNCRSLWLRTMLALAYNFGFRKAELLNMRVRQVDLLNRFLTLDPGTTKNRDGRKVKLTNETYQLLCECLRGKQPDDHVFTWPSGEPVRDIRTSWFKLCKQSGLGHFVCLKCSGSVNDKNRCETCRTDWKRKRLKYAGLIFHDLRRSAVRNMVRKGVPEVVAMRISGHKTRSVFDRYNIVSESDLEQAAQRIEHGRPAEFGHTLGIPEDLNVARV